MNNGMSPLAGKSGKDSSDPPAILEAGPFLLGDGSSYATGASEMSDPSLSQHALSISDHPSASARSSPPSSIGNPASKRAPGSDDAEDEQQHPKAKKFREVSESETGDVRDNEAQQLGGALHWSTNSSSSNAQMMSRFDPAHFTTEQQQAAAHRASTLQMQLPNSNLNLSGNSNNFGSNNNRSVFPSYDPHQGTMANFLNQGQQQQHQQQQQQQQQQQHYPFSQADLSAHLLRAQLARSQQAAVNAALLAQLGTARPASLDSFLGPNHPLRSLQGLGVQQQQQQQQYAPSYPANNLGSSMQGGLDMRFRSDALNAAQQSAAFTSLLAASERAQFEQEPPQDLSAFLRQHLGGSGVGVGGVAAAAASAIHNNMNDEIEGRKGFAAAAASSPPAAASQQHRPSPAGMADYVQPQPPRAPNVLELPPCQEGRLDSSMNRPCFPLSIDEDPNWLSEFHCFVRSDLVEVFRATRDDVKARNNSIAYQQVGIRCRFCAHIPPTSRAGRSSAFPSSMRQIYQSFTMMLRDHFGGCDFMPTRVQDKFMLLKDKPSQGATDSKRYWTYSASKIGMTDSSQGIVITTESRAAGLNSPPFGRTAGQAWEDDTRSCVSLVLPSDRPFVAEFLFLLLTQAQPIRLTEAECIGNRRNLRVGMPGFGCRYCCRHRRLGLSRMFPARRRTLPGKINDLYTHLRRCNVCPQNVKQELETSRQLMNSGFHADQGATRDFFNRVWVRIGHDGHTDSDDT